MGIFLYKALDARRMSIAGTIAADTVRQARELLRDRGLIIETISDHEQATRKRWSPGGLGGRYSAKLGLTMREVATLLKAGIPLLEALDTVIGQQKGKFRTALLMLRERVASGVGLAEAMAEQPRVFDVLCVHMAEVGENAGTLETVLDQWAEFQERSTAFKDRILTALLYPAFVLVVGMAATLFLMTFVIPMLLESLLEAGRPLPWPTQVVKAASDAILAHGWLMGLAAVLLVVGLIMAIGTPSGRRIWHRSLLHIPWLGPMARKQEIARIALIISTLVKSGIEFLRAMEVTARSTKNLVLREALLKSAKEIGAGQEIGKALENTQIFPPMVVRIFTIGQESGRLEEMLDRLATDYDRQVSVASARLMAILEPVLILTLAVFVGFILMATILPILEAGNVL